MRADARELDDGGAAAENGKVADAAWELARKAQ
jgi:hypothetical protein